jgi:hypothetical protein
MAEGDLGVGDAGIVVFLRLRRRERGNGGDDERGEENAGNRRLYLPDGALLSWRGVVDACSAKNRRGSIGGKRRAFASGFRLSRE